MIGAEAAVVGASPVDGGVVDLWHLGGLDEDFAAAAVIIDVIGDEDALRAVLGAAFKEVDILVLKNGFGFDFAVTGGADGDGYIVEEVGTGFGHVRLGSKKGLRFPIYSTDQHARTDSDCKGYKSPRTVRQSLSGAKSIH